MFATLSFSGEETWFHPTPRELLLLGSALYENPLAFLRVNQNEGGSGMTESALVVHAAPSAGCGPFRPSARLPDSPRTPVHPAQPRVGR